MRGVMPTTHASVKVSLLRRLLLFRHEGFTDGNAACSRQKSCTTYMNFNVEIMLGKYFSIAQAH